MAIAVIGGLITSTLLTLVVIPVVYTIVDDIEGYAKRKGYREQWTVLVAMVRNVLQKKKSRQPI
jgi:hypothetical protein